MALFPKRQTNYVSPADRFLQAFDERTPRSASQKAEYEKNRKIAELRDEKTVEELVQR